MELWGKRESSVVRAPLDTVHTTNPQNVLTEVEECQTLQITIEPPNSTSSTTGVPPYYFFAFELNGVPTGESQGGLEVTSTSHGSQATWSVKGVVNDLALFERGEKGKDGLCVVAAVGKEHRLGRWKKISGGRNGAVVFEIPRGKAAINGGDAKDTEMEL